MFFSKFPDRVWEKTREGWYSREATPEDQKRRRDWLFRHLSQHRVNRNTSLDLKKPYDLHEIKKILNTFKPVELIHKNGEWISAQYKTSNQAKEVFIRFNKTKGDYRIVYDDYQVTFYFKN